MPRKLSCSQLSGQPRRRSYSCRVQTSKYLLIDHKPLISILNSKTLDEPVSPRIVRMRGNFHLVACWRPRTEHKVVDCLSRHPVDVPSQEDEAGEIEIERCHQLLHQLACEERRQDSLSCPI